MNSQEEKELFEAYGWEYNSLERKWVSPINVWITQDELMEYTTTRAGEQTLKEMIVGYGRAKD
jgi:hypothetical protein